ncbi:hypothetical protein C8F04DRAFT_1187352 [Mycena alexandri]|uniref:Uncharacterized protein n=1 Tax=Mycena alexandri TaxID=1745969 RepID=A0AAD6WYD6_9AGAR|nr:hypothetical protein C8F04DRAFT_1187352 [Mycena alexandri]
MLFLENDSAERPDAPPMLGVLADFVHRARFVVPHLHILGHKENDHYFALRAGDVVDARLVLRRSISRYAHHLHIHKTRICGRHAFTRSRNILRKLSDELDLAWKVYGEAELALRVLLGR